MCTGQISSAQIDIAEQTRVSQIAIEIISCNFFSDCNVWFCFTAADAKTFAQIRCGTMRSIVGWVRIPDEVWEITMRRLNQKMEHAASLHALPSWSNHYFVNHCRLDVRIALNRCSWAATAIAWMPLGDCVHNFPSAPSRNKGRPHKRWDQAPASFSYTYFCERNLLKAAGSCDHWLAAKSAFKKHIV